MESLFPINISFTVNVWGGIRQRGLWFDATPPSVDVLKVVSGCPVDCAYQCRPKFISSSVFHLWLTKNKYALKKKKKKIKLEPAEIFCKGSNSHVWGGYGLSYYVLCLSHLFSFFFLPSSHPLPFPTPPSPPPPPCLTAPLFLFPSLNKLCMPSPTHGVVHCCTICSKLLLSHFRISLLASQSFCFSSFSISLSLRLSSLPPFTHTQIKT